jgi:hypothetical protein
LVFYGNGNVIDALYGIMNAALESLGAPTREIDAIQFGGMGSEFRAYLGGVKRIAERFARLDIKLANELILAADAVAYSTRYGASALETIAATAITSLVSAEPYW